MQGPLVADASELLRRLVEAHPALLLKRGGAFKRSAVHESGEWMRIVGLPRRDLDLDAMPDLTPLFAVPGGTMKLWPIQSAALLEAEALGGAFLSMPVGGGKSLTAALMPYALHSERTVILVPPQLKRRTLQQVYPELSKHFRLPLDRLHVVSYTELERAPGDVLERLRPDLIVADEAQLLANRECARTYRFFDYFKGHPDTRAVIMTGTPTLDSILDYAHLLNLVLKERSPVPRSYLVLTEWSEALDVSEAPSRPAGALNRLCERLDHVHSDVRDRYACRLSSSPGVLAVSNGFEGTSLTFGKRSFETPPKVAAALDRLRKTWEIGDPEAPEGAAEEITDDLSYSRFARQLACGFYLRWRWPNGRKDDHWLAVRRDWSAAVRHVLRYARTPEMAAPAAVEAAARRRELPKDALAAWDAWAKVKAQPKPPTEAVWIDQGLVEDAASATDGTVVWCENPDLAEAVAKMMGVEPPRKAADLVMDGRPLPLSVGIFGTGVDGLQARYSKAIYTTIPNGKLLQQSLGRLHREGQREAVLAEGYLHTPETMHKFNKTIQQARYAESTGFGRQKILHCTLRGIDGQD